MTIVNLRNSEYYSTQKRKQKESGVEMRIQSPRVTLIPCFTVFFLLKAGERIWFCFISFHNWNAENWIPHPTHTGQILYCWVPTPAMAFVLHPLSLAPCQSMVRGQLVFWKMNKQIQDLKTWKLHRERNQDISWVSEFMIKANYFTKSIYYA